MSTALALCGAAAFSGWTASAGVTRPIPMLRARTPVAGFFDRFENPFSQKAAVEEVNDDSSDAEQKRLRAETLRLKANIGAQRRDNRLAFEHVFELRQGKRAQDHLANPFLRILLQLFTPCLTIRMPFACLSPRSQLEARSSL